MVISFHSNFVTNFTLKILQYLDPGSQSYHWTLNYYADYQNRKWALKSWKRYAFTSTLEEKSRNFDPKRSKKVFGGFVAGIWRHLQCGLLWMGFLRRCRCTPSLQWRRRCLHNPGCRRCSSPGFWLESGPFFFLFQKVSAIDWPLHEFKLLNSYLKTAAPSK